MYFYVDESGDPTVLGQKGKNLLQAGVVSKTFIVGYVETENPAAISASLDNLRAEIAADEYLAAIPSLKQSLTAFHANADSWEVKERVFRLLKSADIKAHMVVARKSEDLFRRKFGFDSAKLYGYLVTKLFENRLHLYRHIDIYFSAMGNTVRVKTMKAAIDEAVEVFRKKWDVKHETTIRVFVQQASQIPMLQVVDYVLWTVHRAYEKDDYRFYEYLKDRISLIQDIFDTAKYPKNYYKPSNPLDAKKISPLGG